MLPLLSESFATLAIGAPKRKAPSGSERAGHYGLRDDSSASLALVALSRVARARDEPILQPASQTPVGSALLSLLKAAVLRVALAVGGADGSLNAQSVTSLFNLSGSGVATQRLYDGGLSLPSKLAWPKAKALVSALLDALNAARGSEPGARVGVALLTLPAVLLDAAIQADLMAMITDVESQMAARLSGGSSGSSGAGSGGGGSGSSGASSSRSTPPPLPELPTVVDAVPIITAINTALTLSANARAVMEARLGRLLSASDRQRLEEALAEALSVLQAGGEDARRKLLAEPMAAVLLTPGAAMVWACVVETVTEADASSVSTLLSQLVATASSIAGTLFASAFGV